HRLGLLLVLPRIGKALLIGGLSVVVVLMGAILRLHRSANRIGLCLGFRIFGENVEARVDISLGLILDCGIADLGDDSGLADFCIGQTIGLDVSRDQGGLADQIAAGLHHGIDGLGVEHLAFEIVNLGVLLGEFGILGGNRRFVSLLGVGNGLGTIGFESLDSGHVSDGDLDGLIAQNHRL